MPKYYCDYCDIYLTHDARKVIRDHCEGWKHKTQVRDYYAQFAMEQAQSMMDMRNATFRPRPPPMMGMQPYPGAPMPGMQPPPFNIQPPQRPPQFSLPPGPPPKPNNRPGN